MSGVLYPLFLRLEGKVVLVVGGGEVAARKATDLADAGARVHVVAPEVNAELTSDARITTTQRPFEEADVNGAWLVIAATDQPEVQARACGAADRARVFSIAVDDPMNGNAISASVLRRGSLTVAIGTAGEAPALARLLREILEQSLPEEDWIEAARALRARWRDEKTPMRSRFAELVRAFKARAGTE
jgi:siroheme synthase-like protein